VAFTGRLTMPTGYELNKGATVMLAGATPGRRQGEIDFLPRQTAHATVQADGTFRGTIERGEFRIAACLFAGTDTLSSAIDAPVPVR
jgi:hypothetical protein